MFASNTSQVASDATFIEDVFSTWLYTGNGSTQTITNGIDLAGKGGLVWIKSRNGMVTNNVLSDTARGVERLLYSNSTGAQVNSSSVPAFTGFLSSGFTLGPDAGNYGVNNNTLTTDYVSWTFREQPKFFDVVTYTGDGAGSREIAHSLGSTPGCVIIKRTDSTGDWMVWHRSAGGFGFGLRLNTTDQAGAVNSDMTAVSSTSVTVTNSPAVNGSGGTYVAYLFAHDAGGFGLSGTDNVITCGSYTTDGSGNATVNLGYEPQWVIWKASSATGIWGMNDSMRGMPVGSVEARLQAQASDAETSTNDNIDPTATGFLAKNYGASTTFIYIAIRRGPMKVPTTGTSVYNAIARTGTGAAATVTGVGFAPDLVIPKARANNSNISAFDRLRGALRKLATTATDAEISAADTLTGFDAMDGFKVGADGTYDINFSVNYINWAFRRAPGCFDVVCYNGTNTVGQTQAHGLNVVPEMMIVKVRTGVNPWVVYHSELGPTKGIYLNLTNTPDTASSFWNNTAPTASVFSLGANSAVNTTPNTYIAYLFATCPGVSKVGSYTGNGSNQTINCGFTGGARFVLIKRTDDTGDWYVWDTARGIVSGNDPYLLLNSTAAEVTNTDYIDTASTGFEISSTAPAAINANGGTFIFLAIA